MSKTGQSAARTASVAVLYGVRPARPDGLFTAWADPGRGRESPMREQPESHPAGKPSGNRGLPARLRCRAARAYRPTTATGHL